VAGTIGQKWTQYKELSSTPLAIKEKPLVFFPPDPFPVVYLVEADGTSHEEQTQIVNHKPLPYTGYFTSCTEIRMFSAATE
jgi:hypothetical protein